MMLNSSGNFFIYCLVGHGFRRELCRTLGLKDAAYLAVPGVSTATTNAGTNTAAGTAVSGQTGGARRSSSKSDCAATSPILANGNGVAITSLGSDFANGGTKKKRSFLQRMRSGGGSRKSGGSASDAE